MGTSVEQLIDQGRRRERPWGSVVDELYRRYHKTVIRRIARAINDREKAEDLAQEVWVRVLQGLPRFRGDAEFETWLFGSIIRNVVNTRGKGITRQHSHEIEFSSLELEGEENGWDWLVRRLAVDPAADPADQLVARETLAELRRAVEGLPEHYRSVIILKLENMTDEQIAQELEIPLGTVKSRFNAAKKILRERWQPDVEEPRPCS